VRTIGERMRIEDHAVPGDVAAHQRAVVEAIALHVERGRHGDDARPRPRRIGPNDRREARNRRPPRDRPAPRRSGIDAFVDGSIGRSRSGAPQPTAATIAAAASERCTAPV
jgi:hypothetical protein